MYGDSRQIKIAAVAAELNHSLPQDIHMYDILFCARQLVMNFQELSSALTDEAREKLLN